MAGDRPPVGYQQPRGSSRRVRGSHEEMTQSQSRDGESSVSSDDERDSASSATDGSWSDGGCQSQERQQGYSRRDPGLWRKHVSTREDNLPHGARSRLPPRRTLSPPPPGPQPAARSLLCAEAGAVGDGVVEGLLNSVTSAFRDPEETEVERCVRLEKALLGPVGGRPDLLDAASQEMLARLRTRKLEAMADEL